MQEPTIGAPEQIFDRRWAITVLDRAFTRLKAETRAAGKARQFEVLNSFLSSEPEGGMRRSGGRIAIKYRNGRVVHRLQAHCRGVVWTEIADTLAEPSQLDAVMAELSSA